MATERPTGGTARAAPPDARAHTGDYAERASPTTETTSASTSSAPGQPSSTTRETASTEAGAESARNAPRRATPAPSARDLMDRAREGAIHRLDSQRERAAGGLGTVADALRQSGQHLERQNPTVASYVETAASQLERLTGSLRDRDVKQIVTDVERYARRRPAMFLGGAFALGIVAARFLKSSSAEAGTKAGAGWGDSRDETWTGGHANY